MGRGGVLLSSLGIACGPAVAEDVAGETSTVSSAGSSDSAAAGTTTTTTTAGESTGGADEDSTTDTPEPLPPGGLGPWGYTFEVLDEIVAAEVLLADFDGDGNIDVFTQGNLEQGTAVIRVHLGTGGGIDSVAFGPAPESVVAWQQLPVAGDFDGDDDLDVAAFDTYADDTFHVALNDGNAEFATSVSAVGAGIFPGFGVAVLDTDGDGRDDLLIPGGHSSGATVYVSDGMGGFTPGAVVPQPACYFSASAAADFDDDGNTDVGATGSCNAIPEALPLMTYRGDGSSLAADQSFYEGPGVLEGGDLVAVDVDDDGDPDLVTGAYPAGLTIVRNDAGTLAPPELREHAWDGLAITIVPVRLLGDAPLGFVLQQDDAAAVVEQVDATSLVATPIDLEGRVVGGADFNLDGRTDLAVLIGVENGVGTLALWLSA